MPYTHLVATAGTSALAAGNTLGAWLRAQASDLVRFDGHRMVLLGEPAALRARWGASLPQISDPMRVSAEYSVLHALRRQGRLGASPRVTLIHTATPDGELAASLLEALIARDFSAHVERVDAGELDADRPADLRRSLGAFMHRVADALRSGDPRSTCFAPLGGYKVMTALGYVAGAFLRYPTLYLHEDNQVPHEVPWVPIRLDEAELRAAASAVRRASQGAMLASLSPDERERVRAMPWLFECSDDGPDAVVQLNAFGHFLRGEARYTSILGPRVLASPQARKDLSRADPRFVWGEIDALLALLADEVRHRGVLRHEATFGVHGSETHLVKGASGRAGVFRAAYRWDAPTETLALLRVWTDHDDYEREARGAIASPVAPTELAPLERPDA